MHFAQISPASQVICMTLIRFPLPHVSSYFVPAMGLQSVLLYLLCGVQQCWGSSSLTPEPPGVDASS